MKLEIQKAQEKLAERQLEDKRLQTAIYEIENQK